IKMELRRLNDRELVYRGDKILFEMDRLKERYYEAKEELELLTNAARIKERIAELKRLISEMEAGLELARMEEECHYQEMKNRGFVCSCGFMLNPIDGPRMCQDCGYVVPTGRK
ncbi:MAG: hypothetical protein AB1652_11130, partial [Bacillota bacterium]